MNDYENVLYWLEKLTVALHELCNAQEQQPINIAAFLSQHVMGWEEGHHEKIGWNPASNLYHAMHVAHRFGHWEIQWYPGGEYFYCLLSDIYMGTGKTLNKAICDAAQDAVEQGWKHE